MAGYSGTPLWKKLGIKEGCSIKVINEPLPYSGLISPMETAVTFSQKRKELDLIHLFARSEKDLSLLDKLKDEIKKEGSIWVSWEKKKVKQPGSINENTVRNSALPLGLVDIKVCAVDEDWSGLKLVWRKEHR